MSAAVLCGIAAIGLIAGPGQPRDREDRKLLRAEVTRLHAHFDSVLAELEARDVSPLRASQRAARSQLVDRLRGYRGAGVFPHNHDFAGGRVPYFRDEHGTLCAMAYLIASTGRQDIVDDVARERNNAYIPALASDPRLVAWLDSVGLTVAEAARIQPKYDFQRPQPVVVEDRSAASYVLPSLALGVPAVVTSVLNWRAPRDKKPDAATWIGAISGAGAMVLGAAIISEQKEDGAAQVVGFADLAAGTASLVAVVRRSLRRMSPAEPRPPVASEASRVSIGVAPAATYAGELRPAARVRVRF